MCFLIQVDDDFLAQYQMSYGFVDPEAAAREEKIKEEEEKKVKQVEEEKLEGKRKPPKEPSKFFSLKTFSLSSFAYI